METVILVIVSALFILMAAVAGRKRKFAVVVKQELPKPPEDPYDQYVIRYTPTIPVAVERELEAARERPGSIYYTRSGRHTR